MIQKVAKYTFVPILLILVAFLSVVLLGKRNELVEVGRLATNRGDSIRIFQDENLAWHTRGEVMELKTVEAVNLLAKYDKSFEDLHTKFETINHNMKNLQYLGITQMRTNYHIKEPGSKDTLYVLKSDTIPAQVATMRDTAGWYDFKAIVINGQIRDIQINTRDSLSTAITYKRKWFLGRKRYQQEIISHNPHSKITYSRSVIIHK